MPHPRLMARWTETDGRLKVFANILPRTLALGFIPDDNVSVIYRAFAKAELHRLQDDKKSVSLRCWHARAQHIVALQSILTRLPEPNSH